MDRLLPEHREGVLHVRGISDEVIDAEDTRYESFSRGEWARFLYLME